MANQGKPRIVLDTNVLISALIYGGIPREILLLVLGRVVIGISSSILLAELDTVLSQRFPDAQTQIYELKQEFKLRLVLVHAHKRLTVVKDDADNRVLEAALAGKAHYIVTGDKELLALKKFRSIKILTPRQFLDSL